MLALLLLFFISLGSHRPQSPDTYGTPDDAPAPKILTFMPLRAQLPSERDG